jgi:agmatine deiminase
MKNRFYFKLTILNLLIVSFISILKAQDLPIYMIPAERTILPYYHFPTSEAKSITSPPNGALRTMAEWEEIQSLCVTWSTSAYYPLLREIIKNARLECEVIVICSDSNSVISNLTSADIPLSNIKFLEKPYNTVWMRDYGANTVYINDVDSLILVDWIYNRPRPKDDTIPSGIADYKGIPLFSTTEAPNDLVHTGGNFMSDGFGTAFSSKLTQVENDEGNDFNVTAKTPAEIDSVLKKFMGIKNQIWWETLPYDGINHIDMHAKLLDEELLLMTEYPTGISDGPQIEANIQYLMSNYNSVFGTPYKILRMPAPPMESNNAWPSNGGDYLTYSNFIFINKTVLVPQYYEEFDTVAIRILRENLSGYKVVGLDCNTIIEASGAIHCITHSIGVSDPLLISHQGLEDTENTIEPYVINATIKHKSNIENATLYYSIDTALGFISVPMYITDETNDIWTANIPPQDNGTQVFYYIDANSFSGKHQVRPITAPNGFFEFRIIEITNLNDQNNFTVKDIYPNPGNAITCIPINSKRNENLKVSVLDINGKNILNLYNNNISKGDRNLFIDCSKLTTGIYLIKFETSLGMTTKKLAVK